MTTKQKADQVLGNEYSIIKTIRFDNLLIKELLLVIDVEDLRQQLRQEERSPTPVHYQLKEEYHLGNKQGPTPLNELENNPSD